MATGTDERVVQIRSFKGLNINASPVALEDDELSDIINYNLGDGGELVKRTGFVMTQTLGVPSVLLGFFQTSSVQYFIASIFIGGVWKLYRSADGITFTLIAAVTGNPQYGVQYVDKFYVVQTDGSAGVVEINTSATAIAEIVGSPSGTFCRVFKDRLFVLNSLSATIASRLYYSKPFDFSATGWPATNFIDVGSGDGDWLIAVWNLQDTLVIFKTGASWNLYVQGDPTLWILRPFNSEIGCISKYSLAVVENILYFVGIRGVYVTDGNTVRNISIPITPAFKNVIISQATINRSSAFIWEDKYIISLETYPTVPIWNAWATVTWNSLATTPWTGGNAAITYLVYHLRQKGWTKWVVDPSFQPHIFISVLVSATLKGVYSNDRLSTKIFKFGQDIYTDDGINYEVAAETKEFDFGLTTEMKRGKWVGATLQGAGDHSFTHVVDQDTLGTYVRTPGIGDLEIKVPGPGYFRSWRLRASATHSNFVTLFGFTMHLHRRRVLSNVR